MAGRRDPGKVIKVHLRNGEPKGPRTLAATNSNTKGIAVPRSEYETVSKEMADFRRPGVYVLVYPPPDSGGFSERVYVGQADVAKDRIDQHHRDPNKDWTWVALFTSRDNTMNNVYAQFLEARLVSLAHEAGRAELVNAVDPQEPTLDEEDQDTATHFLRDILVYCPILGINAFEVPLGPAPPAPPTATTTGTVGGAGKFEESVSFSVGVWYHLQPLADAKGTNTPSGFVVFKGSPLRQNVAASAETRAQVSARRDELLKRGILEDVAGTLRFTRDYTFDSPSGAAILILGYPVSGRTEWVDDSGRTLNDVESAES